MPQIVLAVLEGLASPDSGDASDLTTSRMIIRHGREAAAPEDEKACLDERRVAEETSVAHRYKGRGLIGGSTPNDNLTRWRLTYT